MIVLFHKRIEQWGGAERFLVEEFNSLKEKGYNLKIITFRANKKLLSDQFKEIRNDIVNFESSYFISLFKFFNYLFKNKPEFTLSSFGHLELFLIFLILKNPYWFHIHHPSFMTVNDTDIYHFRDKKPYLKLIKKFNSGKIIVENKKKMSFFQILFYRIRSIISINAFKNAKGIFVLSNYHKYEKRELYGLESNVLYGAFNNNQISSPRKRIINVPKKEVNLLSICRLDPNKRLITALEAIYILKNKNLSLRFDIVGTGDEEEYLKEYVKEKNLKNIFFHGFVKEENLQKYYQKADIFLAIDIADFKLNMHEALLNHIPCIVGEETEIPSQLQKTGFTLKCKVNKKNVSNCILEMVENLKTNHKMFKEEKLENYIHTLKWSNYYSKLIKIMKK